ncbi:protein kinase domain-containing protein [Subtercola frigoramans]|uniref:non-specific serine/threonine protein kinase n=1 Tax=Subtercola frigoramans TaxID=120298 RepID=A0ABS2L533_9MICO|nr:PASTA domain-containing protein [Subtercola frigoramans]MBM7472210.1 serine/threonine-protein kinase [Subtercola frigoramans]
MQHASEGLISGRFRLGDLLGSGGSASVFDAVDVTVPNIGAAPAAPAAPDESDAPDPGAAPTSSPGSEEAPGSDSTPLEAPETHVALKILHPHLSRSPEARDAFFTEALAAEKLRHPNIVAVLGVGVHDPEGEPLAWIALERAPGITLAEFVELNGALSVSSSLALADGLLRALEAAHAVGLVHRDVSPANIMVEPGQHTVLTPEAVRLVDFGLADAAGRPVLGADILRSIQPNSGDSSTRTPGPSDDTLPSAQSASPLGALGVLGSANYMSPEQALGEAVDERGDIYQVGAVLHFALTGRPPFVRDSTSAVMRAHVNAPPPVPSVLYSGIPRAVDRLVVKALLKDPASRYRSAASMREAVLLLEVRNTALNAQRTVMLPQAGITTQMIAPPPLAPRRPTGPPGQGRTAATARQQPPSGPVFTGVSRPTAAAADVTPAQVTPGQLGAASDTPATFGSRRQRGGGAVWAGIILTLTVVAVAWVLATTSNPSSSTAAGTGSANPVSHAATPSATASAEPSQTPVVTAAASTAPSQVAAPTLVSLTLADARAALTAAGLTLGSITSQDSNRAGDTVLSVSRTAVTSVDAGSAVDVVVASGSNAVPVVTGLGQSDAIASIQSAGFAVVVQTQVNGAAAPGTVTGTQPAETSSLRLGSSVTIVVATAPATPAPTPSTTGTPTPSATPHA